MSTLGVVDLASLGLSAQALEERKDCIGGSDANIILGDDAAARHRLWQVKRGEAEAEDLSRVLPVQLGKWTERFNLLWFEMMTGLSVTNPGVVVRCPDRDWQRATLDGLVVKYEPVEEGVLGVFEAKHVNSYWSDLDVFRKYLPQLHHNMLCTGLDRAWLSVLKGSTDWVAMEATFDQDYADQLLAAEEAFWDSVVYGTPPEAPPEPIEAPPLPVGTVVVDMSASNMWCHLAGQFIETSLAADWHEQAREGLKELMPPTATRAHGGGIEIKRTKAGALRINIEKES